MFEVVMLYTYLISAEGAITLTRTYEPDMETCRHHARQLSFMPVPGMNLMQAHYCVVVEERTA